MLASEARGLDVFPGDDHWPEQIVSVVGPSGRLTGKLRKSIRFCCTAPDMISYWQDRYCWSKSEVDLVDTVSIKVSSGKLRGESAIRVQKLRCGWLPVNSRESRNDPDRLAGCSACSTTNLVEETVDHLFQCPSSSRRQAIRDRLSTFQSDLRVWKTSETLISVLLTGVTAWLEGSEPPSIESLNLPDTHFGRMLEKAYSDQTSLGWNVLFRGFWASNWRHAQEFQFSSNAVREKQDSGDIWAGKVQAWFISLFELLWGIRNEYEHGVDPEMQRLISLATCERAIRRLYTAAETLPEGERHPFKTPIEDLLLHSVHNQELWITQTEAYLPKVFSRLRKCKDTRQPQITDFFVRRQV